MRAARRGGAWLQRCRVHAGGGRGVPAGAARWLGAAGKGSARLTVCLGSGGFRERGSADFNCHGRKRGETALALHQQAAQRALKSARSGLLPAPAGGPGAGPAAGGLHAGRRRGAGRLPPALPSG